MVEGGGGSGYGEAAGEQCEGMSGPCQPWFKIGDCTIHICPNMTCLKKGHPLTTNFVHFFSYLIFPGTTLVNMSPLQNHL